VFYTDAVVVVYKSVDEFVVKFGVRDLHCVYRRHILKGDSFLPDVYYVKVKTCGGHVI
jgi:hypothetical protein